MELATISIFVAGYYLHHNLYLTENLFVPTYLATLAGLGLLLLNIQRLPENVVSFSLTVIAVCLASILCNPMFWMGWAGAFGLEYAKAFVVFLSAILASIGVSIGVLHMPPRILRRMLWVFVYVIVIGSLLDVNVPALRSLFQQVSSPFLRFGFEYVNELRDVNMYGSLRPKFLTSEPSNVSIFLVFAFVLLHLLGKPNTSWSSRLHFWGMFAAALIVVRGPTMALVPIVAVLFARRNFAVIFVATIFALALLTVVLFDSDVWAALAKSRLGWVLGGNDRSFFVRQVLPVQVAWEAIMHYPLFGIGFGGKSAAEPLALQLFWESAKRGDWVFEQAEPLGGNGFWIIWTQLGLIGAPLFIWALASFARAMTAWWLPALISIALFFMNGGAPNTMRVWAFTFVLLSVCHIMQPAVAFQRRPAPQHRFKRGALPVTGNRETAFASGTRMGGTRTAS